jgi:mono/diheme cytochrome c family protein
MSPLQPLAPASLLALAALAAPVLAQPPASPTRGHALFMRDGCYECHGTVGQGAVTGPRLAPDAPDLETMTGYLRAPSGQMPPYSPKVISDADIADIHAYLVSVKGPAKGR